MKITLFAKKRTAKDGRTFVLYLTTLTKKNGEEIRTRVKFNGCAEPKYESCPQVIEFSKKNANLSTRSYVSEKDGEMKEAFTLWVKSYIITDEEYVDRSLEDFE